MAKGEKVNLPMSQIVVFCGSTAFPRNLCAYRLLYLTAVQISVRAETQNGRWWDMCGSVALTAFSVSLLFIVFAHELVAEVRFPNLDDFNVVWDTPSKDALGSMPLGNGDITLNLWVEEGGDLLFYIGKSDAWDEYNRLLKLGKVRISLSPNPFVKDGKFRQELVLRRGEVVIQASPSKSSKPVEIRVWVDANHPVIHVTVESERPLTATASFELWRTEPTLLTSFEVSDIYNACPNPLPVVIEPDTIIQGQPDGIGWFHFNKKSEGPELTMRFQDLLDAPWHDPLIHRIFGAFIRVDGKFEKLDDRHLRSPNKTHHRFSIYVLTEQPSTPERWLSHMLELIKRIEAIDFERRRKEHIAWWEKFWKRSWIFIRDRENIQVQKTTHANSPGYDVCLGYILQRFITACAGRGAYPIKFNGSLFVMPWPGCPNDADYRRWGPGYWWQNTRLPYLSACTSGDFDIIQPLFRMYAGEVFEVCKYRTRRYFGFEGAYFPECVYPWGAVFMDTYGWEKPAVEREDKLQSSRWHKYEWVGGLELVHMMLDYYEHTLDERFLREKVIPVAYEVLKFFDNFYATGPDGKLIMEPAQALETWWDCRNPMPEIAGLHAVTSRLIALSDKLPSEVRSFVERFSEKIPPLPVREVNGVKMLAPAERFATKMNVENPELYAVFPFRLVSFEKPNAELGINALRHRLDKGNFGWRQDEIFMAYLGLAREAKEYIVGRARAKNPLCRFPAFWGHNYDWTPDQDHGGVLMKALQAMLMQTKGKKIFLFPAWVKEWDVHFKLHAPYRTIVEGKLVNGKLVELKVTPKERMKDVVILEPQ